MNAGSPLQFGGYRNAPEWIIVSQDPTLSVRIFPPTFLIRIYAMKMVTAFSDRNLAMCKIRPAAWRSRLCQRVSFTMRSAGREGSAMGNVVRTVAAR